MSFKKVNQKENFPGMEKRILEFWSEKNIFERSVRERPSEKEFTFYDGPPFATGLPHYGHLLAGFIKDVIPRYKTMQGYRVERIWGWDTHGLPIENIVENELGFTNKKQIEDFGIEKFNEACRTKVLTYAEEWKKIVERTGRWVDMENSYLTMDPKFMETVWWVFKELYDKKLISPGFKVMPFCPRCSTPLSNFELGQGYADKTDKAITVKFEIDNEPNTFLLAWTTTPWTLPANMALALGKNIQYIKLKVGDEFFILAQDCAEKYFSSEEISNSEKIDTKMLLDRTYVPLFSYFKNTEGSFRLISGDFVNTEDGTGIVHIAPAFGEDDNRVSRQNKVGFVLPVDEFGKFTEDVADYFGMSVVRDETNEKIISDLLSEGKVVKTEKIRHSYPHCYRCETPLIYRAVSSWFVEVPKIKERILELNQQIYWMPEFVGKSRFAKIIENAPEWNISRNRYWGTPLPIWKCEKCSEEIVMGSISELEEACGLEINDIHLHKIKDIELECKCGSRARLSGEVLDCWFESGSMPYASNHYPFDNKEKFEKNFPGDFIAEGIDQTRGWFNSLLILSTALFDRPAMKNVVVNGIILAENGQKMSKRLKNYPDPLEILENYGADSMRFYLMSSPAVKAEDLRFSEKGVDEVVKKIILTLWNSYSFFVTYATIDEFVPTGKIEAKNNLDYWVISETNQLIKNVTEAFECYDLSKVAKLLSDYIDNLSNWYIRRSRRRFWKSENDADKMQAYETLYYILNVYIKLLAPYMPFITEEIYQNLALSLDVKQPISIHLTKWPQYDEAKIDIKVNEMMRLARKIVNQGLSARAAKNIKVRQPLSEIYVYYPGRIKLSKDLVRIIEEELNVKRIIFKEDIAADDFVVKEVKIDFSLLGPKYGDKVKEIAKDIVSGNYAKEGDSYLVLGEKLTEDEIITTFKPKSDKFEVAGDNEVTVAFNVEITEELKKEGIARDVTRIIQDMRKNADLEVDNKINIYFETTSDVLAKIILEEWGDYIRRETLANEIVLNRNSDLEYNEDVLLDEVPIWFGIKKQG